jgi:hypothetical protein
MSGDGGFINWIPPFGHQGLPQDGSIYLDGQFYRDWPEVEGGGLSVAASDGVILLETLARTHIVQVPYRGTAAPLVGDKREFGVRFLVDREEDFIRFELSRQVGRLIYFCPGLWLADIFPATSGSVYSLTRPLASAVVPGVTSITHPPRFYLDGVEDANAATVTGQSVLANDTGELAVWYMPAFRVVILGFGYEIADVNDLRVSTTLSEGVIGSFG